MNQLFFNPKNQEFTSKTDNIYRQEFDNSIFDKLNTFNSINIFIGANNSGKSRLMRGILKSEAFILTNAPIDKNLSEAIEILDKLVINQWLKNLKWNTSEILKFNAISWTNLTSISTFLESLNEFTKFSRDNFHSINILVFQTSISWIIDFINAILELTLNTHKVIGREYKIVLTMDVNPNNLENYKHFIQFQKRELEKIVVNLEKIKNTVIERFNPPLKVYIPSLRSMYSLYNSTSSGSKNVSKLYSDVFEFTVVKNYDFDEDKHMNTQKISIHTGLSMYKEILNSKNGIDLARDAHREFEDFLRANFFSKLKKFELFSMIEDRAESNSKENIYIRLDNEESRPIHNIGDGIQTLVNILYSVFTSPNSTWFFIEEPEIHLHPGLQRVFMEVLLTNEYVRSKNLRFFFTTHSNHILDIAALSNEVSIYSLKKVAENKHIVRNVKAGDVSILDELGVQNSSVYLANCTIWVEGPTDRLYILKYLQCYLKHLDETDIEHSVFHEDLEFAFYLYGGSNIVQFYFGDESELDDDQKKELGKIESKFLSNRILLFADKDEGKDERHNKLEGLSNDSFIYKRIPVKEIENLLSKEFLLSNLHKVVTSVKKEEIQKLNIDEEKLKDEYLGSYIVGLAHSQTITFPKSFKGESGTVNSNTYKRKLAEVAYDNMTWELMTVEAQDIAKRVYEFIARHNGKSS